MTSPTFILMRIFKIKNKKFFHIDAWRDRIDFRAFLKDPRNILLVEWSDKVKKFLPRDYFLFRFRSPTSPGSRTSREITLWGEKKKVWWSLTPTRFYTAPFTPCLHFPRPKASPPEPSTALRLF